MGDKKTARKTAPGRPFSQGDDARRGVGRKGRSGRKPNWLKEWCDDQLAKPEAKAAVVTILTNPDHPAFASMWRAVTERAHGKAAQPIEHSGTIAMTHSERVERLRDVIGAITTRLPVPVTNGNGNGKH